jgi:UDP-N-acetyl-D-glucosamine dehydrogenase
MRESPTFELMDRFAALGAAVSYYDPHVPVIGPTREHAKWQGVKSVAWDRATISAADAVVIATNHKAVNLAELADWAPLVVDTRDAMKQVRGKSSIVKA